MVNFIRIFLITLLIMSCNGMVKTRVTMASTDIEASKENGVFVDEYLPSKNYIENDSMDFYFYEVWIEYQWYYKNQLRQIEIEDNIIMLLRFDTRNFTVFENELPYKYFEVENSISRGFTNVENSNKLSASFYEYSDTIRFTFFEDQVVEFVKKK